MSYISQLKEELNTTLTENGDPTNKSSLSRGLDFFALGGSMRNSSKEEILSLFTRAYVRDPLTALRTLFYLRDVRGGQGERRLFRIITSELAQDKDKNLLQNLHLFAEYGRWDDLVELLETPIQKEVIDILVTQLLKDIDAENPSLLAKWLPSENTSSKTSRKRARLIIKELDVPSSQYRKMLTKLRKTISVVETQMSANNWEEINFERVPSKAMMVYNRAFERHCPKKYNTYISAVEAGEAKINSGTLYPYELYDKVKRGDYNKAIEEQWKSLPDYTRGNNALVVADVSGSMMGRPMSVSVSLALYFAERNKGIFKDYFITFSSNPQLQEIKGTNLQQRIRELETAGWQMSTDLRKVFTTILKTAVKNDTPVEEMPSTLYIISDMQFNGCVSGNSSYEDVKKMYESAGYILPTVVFWNVDDRGNHTLPATKHDDNTTLVSGFSPSIFQLVVENKTPLEVMQETVNSDRYKAITLAE